MTMSGSSVETRDCAIQMLDKFIAVLDLPTDSQPLRPADKSIISLAAAAAVILASKIHEIRPLRTSNFPHFKKEQLIDFERRFLLKISFQIVPQSTPSAFLRYLLNLWPLPNNSNANSNDDIIDDPFRSPCSKRNCRILHRNTNIPPIPYKEILVISDTLLGLFWEDPECMCYAPSTIAISALLLTFSKLHLDCTDWLHKIPDECLPPKTDQHMIFPSYEVSYLDIDNCLLSLQRIPLPQKYINMLNKGMNNNCNALNKKVNSNNNNNNDLANVNNNDDNSNNSNNIDENDCNNEIDDDSRMNCDINIEEQESEDSSSVRTITPTSTAELNDDHMSLSKQK